MKYEDLLSRKEGTSRIDLANYAGIGMTTLELENMGSLDRKDLDRECSEKRCGCYTPQEHELQKSHVLAHRTNL